MLVRLYLQLKRVCYTLVRRLLFKTDIEEEKRHTRSIDPFLNFLFSVMTAYEEQTVYMIARVYSIAIIYDIPGSGWSLHE